MQTKVTIGKYANTRQGKRRQKYGTKLYLIFNGLPFINFVYNTYLTRSICFCGKVRVE